MGHATESTVGTERSCIRAQDWYNVAVRVPSKGALTPAAFNQVSRTEEYVAGRHAQAFAIASAASSNSASHAQHAAHALHSPRGCACTWHWSQSAPSSVGACRQRCSQQLPFRLWIACCTRTVWSLSILGFLHFLSQKSFVLSTHRTLPTMCRRMIFKALTQHHRAHVFTTR